MDSCNLLKENKELGSSGNEGNKELGSPRNEGNRIANNDINEIFREEDEG